MSIATTEPASFVAGDTVQWIKTVSDYLPADGWVLAYTWSSAGATFSVTASDNGDGRYLVDIPAATSIGYAPGEYKWQANVTLALERHTVDWGSMRVSPDYASTAPQDSRTTARRLLDAVEAALEGRADTDQLSYSVGGVSISRMTLSEMLAARNQLKAEVGREDHWERVRNGLGSPQNILVRL